MGQKGVRGPTIALHSGQQRSGPGIGDGGPIVAPRAPPASVQLPQVLANNGASLDEDNYEAAVESDTAQLTSTTRTHAEPTVEPQMRRRLVGARADSVPEYRYATLPTELRATYERLRDWARSQPIIELRKRCRPGKFDSYRLRALQKFCLTVGGGAVLTCAQQDELYNLQDVWEGTQLGMPVDAGHDSKLRDIFTSCHAFNDALRDDVDAALLNAGWRKCKMDQNGDTLTAFFRPVLYIILKLVRDSKDVKLWSGGDGPAPPTSMRESPLDGDAFRLNEADVVREHGLGAFVLGMNAYSDATHISKSGG